MRVSLLHQFLTILHIDQSLNRYLLPLLFLFLRLRCIFILLKPFFPMLDFILIVLNPVKKSHNILRLKVLDGSLAKNGVTAHINKTLVLLIVLHDSKKYQITNMIKTNILDYQNTHFILVCNSVNWFISILVQI